MSSFKVLCFCLSLAAVTSQSVPTPFRVQLVSQPELQPAAPYQFGFEFGDGLGMTQHRHESSDGSGSVEGTYGYTDPLGVLRTVNYKAGADGYRAVISSNEPGLVSHAPADASYVVQPPPLAALRQGLKPVIVLE